MKYRELSKLTEKERKAKIKDLKLELIKARITASKGGKAKIKEIKKNLARLLMLNKKQ